ncbi:4Fe-4S cluster-binding domain-containing protein [Neomegalonema sp.]|uniref:4Fe-4S cluster-binding domain-containing protein n=1 Tax=Neomegalonema sp. TaxID=2039713 RepID=UPI0026200EBB|nr:4Fe-4S cluster-binding domain-containing protein [Neomegalonema sp.]MDD2869299.1 4Fe-4S cluster-binding domain-containing protein [Neomegalonema sp.]
MRIAVSRLHHPVTALGPGRRIGLWLQGCSIRCPGCVSVDTWAHGLGLAPVAEVVARLAELAGDADGLTVSGGEPFEQPEALAAVLTAWRGMSGRSVLVFTGREVGEVEGWLEAHPGLIDALVTGPFRSDLPQTMALRGSDNQELRILTPLGEEMRAWDRPLRPEDRRLDVMFDAEGNAWLAGIPARGDMARLRRALAAAGHDAASSDMRSLFPT